MARGGKRPGTGRPKGSCNRKTKQLQEAVAASGATPLQVMLEAMRRHHANGNWDKAAAIARDAAPYVHPRLSAVTYGGDGQPIELEIVRSIVSVRSDDEKAENPG